MKKKVMTALATGLITLEALIDAAGLHARVGSLWERHCGACHDGLQAHGRKLVAGRERIKTKYKTMDEFLNACGDSTSCMNILKHNKRLFREVGKEIGIEDISSK